MTARKRKSVRERLLAYVGGDGSVDYMGEDARRHTRTVRRLLRAHERELAERVWAAAEEEVGFWYTSEERRQAAIARIVAAILGPKRGRR